MTKIRIGGALTKADGAFDVIDPATGEAFAQAPDVSERQLDAMIERAREAQRAWAKDIAPRRAALHGCAAIMRENADALAATLCREQGKPFAKARREIMGAARWFEYTADLEIPSEVLVDTPEARVVAHRRPIGVVGAITPWNYPVMEAAWKIAPALLAGNAVVVKPSPYTPLSTLQLADLFAAIIPDGVLAVASGANELGATLSAHPLIGKVTFTGSTATGKKVYAAGAPDLKALTLELGGNDAAIVLDDVDPDAIADKLFWGAFENSGQVCVAIKRLYVHESVIGRLTKALHARIAAARVGPAMEADVELGPINNAAQLARVESLVANARDAGGRIEIGGSRIGHQGYFFAPTLVTGLDDDARLVREEQFGPALPVLPFRDLDDAFARANSTQYGLAGSIWSGDAPRAAALAGELHCGTVWINQHLAIIPQAPIAGWKSSGVGVENGLHGLLAFTQFQTVSAALA